MATYNTRRKRRWQSSPDEKRRRLNMSEENSPRKRRRTRTVESPLKCVRSSPSAGILSNSDDDSPSFNAKSFYGSKPKLVKPVIQKSLRVLIERCPLPNSPSAQSSPASQSSVASGFTKRSSRDTNKTEKLKAVIRNKRINGQRRYSEDKYSCNTGKHSSRLTSNSDSYKRLPLVTITPTKSVSNKSTAKQDVLVTKNPKGSLTPAVPINTKKFFKHTSPASASISVGSIIVRKGFDLKFIPRRLSERFWKESQKKEKKMVKTKKFVTKKVRASQAGGSRMGHGKEIVDEGDSGEYSLSPNVKSVSLPFDGSDFETTQSDNVVLKPSEESPSLNTLADHSPTSSISLLSEIHTSVADSVQLCTGSQDLFSSDDKSESSNKSGLSRDAAVSPTDGKKLFPIFDVNSRVSSPGSNQMSLHSSPRASPRLRALIKEKAGMEQMILDAGQKKFGATQCDVCGMVYTHADPTDETTHAKFHQGVINALKFPGWKKERVVQEFPNEGSRVIMVLHDDHKYATKKVEEINKIMGEELGFPEQTLAFRPTFKAFLYISDEKTVEGCCIAEPITEGYRVIPDTEANTQHGGQRPWCCQTEPESATVGISRLWVYGLQRNKGIGTRLVDCVRQCFEYGFLIEKENTAFSDPTPDGKMFASKYVGTEAFLVYKYRPVVH